jgi:predicted transposase/invertase (TIGR01784 family)
LKAKYINPYTDFGFKKLFGEEANKDLLIDFLNQLLPEKHKIKNLTFKNNEQWGVIASDKKAVFDIHCESTGGERFIVEMQKAKIKFFKDRSLFYTSFPIREQAEKGEWDFQLNPIYCVAILDFVFDDDRKEKNHITNVQLKDQFCQIFYNKLTYIFIEMPRFTKTENQLENHFDKWLYFLKHLEDFDAIPDILNEEVFLKGFEIARIANFDRDELSQYEKSLMYYRDLKGVIDTSFEDGEKLGYEKGAKFEKLEIARKMKTSGSDIEFIQQITGLSKKEIQNV